MLINTEGRRRRGWQRTRCLDGITDSMDMSLSKLWDAAVCEVAKSQTRLSNWTMTTLYTENKVDSEGKSEYPFLKSSFRKPDTDPLWRNQTCNVRGFCWFQFLITVPFASFMTQRRRVMSVLERAWVLSRFRCIQLFATLQPSRLLCPWDSPGKESGVGVTWESPVDCKTIFF